jgi:hypothetical protein
MSPLGTESTPRVQRTTYRCAKCGTETDRIYKADEASSLSRAAMDAGLVDGSPDFTARGQAKPNGSSA